MGLYIAADDPASDDVRAVLARHLAFARLTLPELYAEASAFERFAIKRLGPGIIQMLFQTFVHPGVYSTVGLPALPTWKAANASPERIAIRHTATRPILKALIEAGITRPGRIPPAWRKLCGVDAQGNPLT